MGYHTEDNIFCKCENAEYIEEEYICKLSGEVCKVNSNKFECIKYNISKNTFKK